MFKTELQKKLRHRFFVTPTEGHNFSGVLLKRTSGFSVFVDCKAHLPNTNPTPLMGELYIENSKIAYVQLLPTDLDRMVVNADD